jgi:hypothetical protein
MASSEGDERGDVMRPLTLDKAAVAPDHNCGAGGLSAELHVFIVSATDGALFAVVATNEQQCVTRLAGYVAEQASLQLWPRSARRVQEHLAAGNAAEAVGVYFRRVGERWDREWLATTSLHLDSQAGIWSGPVPLPRLDRFGSNAVPR